jgi:membrane-associated phospholipid phosphatase
VKVPRHGRLRVVVGAALSFCFPDTSASAQTRQLRWNPALDVTVTSVGAAGWVATEVFGGALAASHCRWCNVDSVDAGLRDALIWRNTTAADTISDVTGFVLMPLAALGLDTLAASHDGTTSHVPEDALLIAEATVVAEDVTQLTKLLVGRERPFVHALSPDQKALTAPSFRNNASFFSGHASEAFALAAASGTISEMRGYRWATVTWSIGGAIAATTAYLRIAADRHWLTDVVVGAVVGAGLGFAIPYVLHPAVDEPQRASLASAALRTPVPAAAPVMTLSW